MSTDGSSELVRSLNAQLADANRKLANRTEQAKRLTTDNAALKTRLGELETANGSLTTERDDFKKRAESAPSEKDAEIQRLGGELKSRDLRDLFTTTAAKGITVEIDKDGKKEQQTLKVKSSAVLPLLDQLKLKPSDKGELPTEAQITEALKGAVTAHDWAFQGETPNPAADAATRQITTRAATAGPGTARSVPDTNSNGKSVADVVNAGFSQWGSGNPGRI